MGANLSQSFPTPEECDRWAEQQTRLAAQWNLQKTADLGNRSVVRVPVVSPAGQPDEITVPVEPGAPVEPRIHAHLHKTRRFALPRRPAAPPAERLCAQPALRLRRPSLTSDFRPLTSGSPYRTW